jgi:hypothetical protein
MLECRASPHPSVFFFCFVFFNVLEIELRALHRVPVLPVSYTWAWSVDFLMISLFLIHGNISKVQKFNNKEIIVVVTHACNPSYLGG